MTTSIKALLASILIAISLSACGTMVGDAYMCSLEGGMGTATEPDSACNRLGGGGRMPMSVPSNCQIKDGMLVCGAPATS